MSSKPERKAQLLDGAPLAASIKREVAADVTSFLQETGRAPALAAVRVGDDPASAVYVGNKIKACEEVGIRSEHIALPETTSQADLLAVVNGLNSRDDIDGILVQLPLPKQ